MKERDAPGVEVIYLEPGLGTWKGLLLVLPLYN